MRPVKTDFAHLKPEVLGVPKLKNINLVIAKYSELTIHESAIQTYHFIKSLNYQTKPQSCLMPASVLSRFSPLHVVKQNGSYQVFGNFEILEYHVKQSNDKLAEDNFICIEHFHLTREAIEHQAYQSLFKLFLFSIRREQIIKDLAQFMDWIPQQNCRHLLDLDSKRTLQTKIERLTGETRPKIRTQLRGFGNE